MPVVTLIQSGQDVLKKFDTIWTGCIKKTFLCVVNVCVWLYAFILEV